MMRVVLIGYGNLGKHLAQALAANEQVSLLQICTSQVIGDSQLQGVERIQQPDQLKPADLYLMAIADDHIASRSQALPNLDGLVAHCSGSTNIQALCSNNRAGVFYPLQTFSKKSSPIWEEIPICIEATNRADLHLLQQLALAISPKVFNVSSEQRLHLHLAAVLVNNFGNHLMHMAQEQLGQAQLSYQLLLPLMQETLDKIKRMPPVQAQTGPAVRGDKKTMEQHLALLQAEEKELYSLFSKLIKQSHDHEL